MATLKQFSIKIIAIASVSFLLTVYYYIPFKFEYIGYRHKVWAHRVNSVERLKYTQENYYGVELDLVFDAATNTFDVNHPPATSIGLTLESYFSHLNPSKSIGIWLDLQNLTQENKDMALKRLNFLTEKYPLQKEHIIVESESPKFLTDFQKSGFKTSYYLPWDLYKLPEEKQLEKIKEIKENICQYPTSAISTNLNDYPIIAEHFPNNKKYLWSLKKTYAFKLFGNFILTRKALNDSNVDVLLVKVNRQKGKR